MSTATASRKNLEFPAYLQELRDLMRSLVEIMESGPGRYAFAFLEEKVSKQVNIQRTESNFTEVDRGMVLRIVAGGRNFESATNDLSPDNLRAAAENLSQRVTNELQNNAGGLTYEPAAWSAEDLTSLPDALRDRLPAKLDATTPVHFGIACELSPFATGLYDLTERAREIRATVQTRDEEYRKERTEKEELASVAVTVRQAVTTHVFVDREKNMSQCLPVSMAIVRGATIRGSMGRVYAGGMGGLEIVKLNAAEVDEAAVRPHLLDDSERLEPGEYKIITGPDVTGVFAHEAFGHTQEGDTWLQGRSIATDMQANGQKAGNNAATIINDPGLFAQGPHDFGTNGSLFFDHEGQLARPQTILDAGMLTEPMTDLLSSLKLGVPRTANGKRESWRRPTLTRQTNTYITAGDKTLAELIGMVDYGFLAEASHGGMEDPKGARLTVGAEYFEEIKDGKLTGRLFVGARGGHIELSGYVPDLLGGIRAKSKTDPTAQNGDSGLPPENKIGGCGKFHKEAVPAGCGGPYVLWDRVTCG